LEPRSQSSNTPPILVLNASPDAHLRDLRAKILNDAGYYTSSARTAAEVLQLSSRMHCDVAIVCHSFNHAEQQAIHEQLERTSPTTRLLVLDEAVDVDPNILLNRVKKALFKLEVVKTGGKSA
jgi:DNA-binding NtrC family response regulator